MGILDKLGLRKSPPDFSIWLEERLKAMKGQGGSAEIAEEIGERVHALTSGPSAVGLEVPIDAWVERADLAQVMDMFMDGAWLTSSGAGLEGEAKEGFDQLLFFLDLLGVSNATEFMRDPGWTMDRTDALGGMVNVVWPVGDGEDAMRAQLAKATRLSDESVLSVLFELRRWTLGFVLLLSFRDHPALTNRIRGLVLTVVRDRYLTGVEPPEDDPEWPLSVSISYNEAIGLEETSTRFLRLMGHSIGRRFAQQLGAAGYPAIRGIGTRVFMDAFQATLGFANAIKKAA